MTTLNRLVQYFGALVDDVVELIFGAGRIVAKEIAQL
jgi:hypothetical protein